MPLLRPLRAPFAVLALVLAGCGSPDVDIPRAPDAPPASLPTPPASTPTPTPGRVFAATRPVACATRGASEVRAVFGDGRYQASACRLRATPATGVRPSAITARVDAPLGTWTVAVAPSPHDAGEVEVTFERPPARPEWTASPMVLTFEATDERGLPRSERLELRPAEPRALLAYDVPRLAAVRTVLAKDEGGADVLEERAARRRDDGTIVLRFGEPFVVEAPFALGPGVEAGALAGTFSARPREADVAACTVGSLAGPDGVRVVALRDGGWRHPGRAPSLVAVAAEPPAKCRDLGAPSVDTFLAELTFVSDLDPVAYGADAVFAMAPFALDGDVTLGVSAEPFEAVWIRNVARYALNPVSVVLDVACGAEVRHATLRPAHEARPHGLPRLAPNLPRDGKITWTRDALKDAVAGALTNAPACAEGWHVTSARAEEASLGGTVHPTAPTVLAKPWPVARL